MLRSQALETLLNLLNLTWPCSKDSQNLLRDLLCNLLRNPMNLTWLCTKASWNLLWNLLRNPVEPDLAAPKPPRPSPEPSEPSPEPRWTWHGACTSAHQSYSGLKTPVTPVAYAVGEMKKGCAKAALGMSRTACAAHGSGQFSMGQKVRATRGPSGPHSDVLLVRNIGSSPCENLWSQVSQMSQQYNRLKALFIYSYILDILSKHLALLLSWHNHSEKWHFVARRLFKTWVMSIHESYRPTFKLIFVHPRRYLKVMSALKHIETASTFKKFTTRLLLFLTFQVADGRASMQLALSRFEKLMQQTQQTGMRHRNCPSLPNLINLLIDRSKMKHTETAASRWWRMEFSTMAIRAPATYWSKRDSDFRSFQRIIALVADDHKNGNWM